MAMVEIINGVRVEDEVAHRLAIEERINALKSLQMDAYYAQDDETFFACEEELEKLGVIE